jgi:peptide/nickel transport system permease protein
LVVAVVIFTLIHMIPGDVLMAKAAEGGSFTPETLAKLRHELGLDQPLWKQFATWSFDMARGDLGESLYTDRPVVKEMWERLPVTLELAAIAMVFSITIATVVGIVAAIRQDTWIDYLFRVSAIGFISVPNFWIGTLIVVLPVLWWGYMPQLEYAKLWVDPITNLQQMLPPALAVGASSVGATTRMARSSLLEVFRQDYIRTAWSKGLSERSVIMRHALRNALIPVITLWGTYFGYLMGGTVIIESIFSLPGLGQLIILSIGFRDYPMLMGAVMWIAAGFILVNLMVDLLYGVLDPRISYS